MRTVYIYVYIHIRMCVHVRYVKLIYTLRALEIFLIREKPGWPFLIGFFRDGGN